MKLPLRRPAVVLAATMAALAVALPSAALAHPRAKEFPLEEFAGPNHITTGPDGALWASDGSLNRLWRVSTTGTASSIQLEGGAVGVATGRDGALWVSDRDFSRIQRVTTSGQVTSYPLPTEGAFPSDIVAGPDGALWFTESRGNKIGRITTGGQITEYPIPTPDASAADIAVGPDHAIWFTESNGNKVGRVSLSGQLTEFPLETPESLPGPIVAGRDGAIYFAERNTNVITRLTTAGEVTRRFPLPVADANPVDLLATPYGLLIAEHSTGSIRPMSYWGWFGHAARTTSEPDALTRGPDGRVWYAAGNEGTIGRLGFGL
jgi:virginiamycin B lyase